METRYSAQRTVLRILEWAALIGIVIGIVAAIMGYANAPSLGGPQGEMTRAAAMLPGIGMAITAASLWIFYGVMRAIFETADSARRLTDVANALEAGALRPAPSPQSPGAAPAADAFEQVGNNTFRYRGETFRKEGSMFAYKGNYYMTEAGLRIAIDKALG